MNYKTGKHDFPSWKDTGAYLANDDILLRTDDSGIVMSWNIINVNTQ
jgi:hypothetical protein